MNMNWSFNKVVNILIFGLAVGVLIAGCGGGGGGERLPTGTDAFSYIADQQSGGFVGKWWYGWNGVSSVEKADVETLAASGVNRYTSNLAHQVLSIGSWATDTNPDLFWNLIPSLGWHQSPDTATFVDSGDGTNITITPTDEPGFNAAVARTDLANTAIGCTSSAGTTIPCTNPGNYPAGSASYQLTVNYASNKFQLYGDTLSSPITNASGVVLTSLPALNTTFCDPRRYNVYQAQGSGGVYNIFATLSCSTTDINAAIATTALGTVTINIQPTLNALVVNVLHVQSGTTTYTSAMTDVIYGLRAGKVWYGYMLHAGNLQADPELNKTAMNAQLHASGLATF